MYVCKYKSIYIYVYLHVLMYLYILCACLHEYSIHSLHVVMVTPRSQYILCIVFNIDVDFL